MGAAACLEALMPRMIARGRGRIAVVASVAGYRGLPTGAYYGASKAALINLTESLKFDLDRAGVTIQLSIRASSRRRSPTGTSSRCRS